MKLTLVVLYTFISLCTYAQSIELENLNYDIKESKIIFGGENLFKIKNPEKITMLEYDKSLVTITIANDSLRIHIIHRVNYRTKTSNWDGKNRELTVAFSTKNDKQTVTFQYRKLVHAFPSIAEQPERAKIAKENILANKKVAITTAGPDTEGFFKNYTVQQFKLAVNDKTFEVVGDKLSDEALAAIGFAKTGDKLTLLEVNTFNDVTGRKLKFGPTIYVLK